MKKVSTLFLPETPLKVKKIINFLVLQVIVAFCWNLDDQEMHCDKRLFGKSFESTLFSFITYNLGKLLLKCAIHEFLLLWFFLATYVMKNGVLIDRCMN